MTHRVYSTRGVRFERSVHGKFSASTINVVSCMLCLSAVTWLLVAAMPFIQVINIHSGTARCHCAVPRSFDLVGALTLWANHYFDLHITASLVPPIPMRHHPIRFLVHFHLTLYVYVLLLAVPHWERLYREPGMKMMWNFIKFYILSFDVLLMK